MQEEGLLYQKISGIIEQHIRTEVLKSGERLPSLRTICEEHGVSMNTAVQSYHQLEKKGLIESRPQSGYYVSYAYRKLPPIPATSQPELTYGIEEIENIIAKVSANGRKCDIAFSGTTAADLLPVAKLNKAIISAMRSLPDSGIQYSHEGSNRLKRQIARRSMMWGGSLEEADIITTAGCMDAIAYSMIALTSRGDTIAVESPVFFGILQLARSLGLNVLELPTNPHTGVEIDSLKKAILRKKVKLCLLVSNFSNPLGSTMPDEHKKAAADLATAYNTPLIEDDLYGDLHHGHHRPATCKTFDQSGNVLWCGSFSKTLAPGYRVGWVAPGKYKEQLQRTKRYHSVSTCTLTHEAVAHFLEHDRYDNHLRKLRQALQANSIRFLQHIHEHFPNDTHVSRPLGGFLLWLELGRNQDAMKLYNRAIQHRISISPGIMYTLQKQYANCIRLSFGMQWNSEISNALKVLGTLAKKL